MMNLDEIKKALEDRNLKVVAAKTGLSYDTVRRIYSGEANHSLRTIKIMSDYLKGN